MSDMSRKCCGFKEYNQSSVCCAAQQTVNPGTGGCCSAVSGLFTDFFPVHGNRGSSTKVGFILMYNMAKASRSPQNEILKAVLTVWNWRAKAPSAS